MDFGEVLSRAGRITWRYKGLWVLGVLASCGSGNGGGGGGGGSNLNTSFDTPPDSLPQVQSFLENINEGVLIAIVLALILLLLFVGLIFFVLGIMGQAGLIHGFDAADEGEDVGLRSAFKGGLAHFWRLLGLKLLLIAAGIAVAIAVIGFLFVVGIATLGVGLICLLPLLCLIFPAAIAIGVYVQLSQVAIVVESVDIFSGLRAAWDLVKKEPGPLIAMAAILVLGGGLAGLLLAAPLIGLAIPVVGGIAIGTDTAVGAGIGLAVLGFLIYLPIMIVLSGILQTYLQGAWTITYRRLTDRPGAELARM